MIDPHAMAMEDFYGDEKPQQDDDVFSEPDDPTDAYDGPDPYPLGYVGQDM